MPKPKSAADWPPHVPRHLVNVMAPFTPYKDGWCRWYKGRTVHVCGRRTPLEEIEDRWLVKKQEVDGGLQQAAKQVTGGLTTVREAAGRFFEYLDHRANTGTPEPLSDWTRVDYVRVIKHFARCVGADRPLSGLGPPDFELFAKEYAGQAPSTLGRVVAYTGAFLRWCKDEGLLAELPQFGRYFVKPAVQRHRDVRLGQRKSYTPAELRALKKQATVEELAWMALGLCGAMDNSDVAHLTAEVVDQDAGLIDYRRRKVGKVRRLIPLPNEAMKWLKAYQRPPAADVQAHGERVFLTPTGQPLLRIKPNGKVGREARSNPIDYVSMRWTRLCQRAGLRPKPVVTRGPDGKRRVKYQKWAGAADRRGFRGLRTTFANLAPPGYRDEVEIIMGHASGTVLLENYIEAHGMDRLIGRLREVVDHVWHVAFKSKLPPGGAGPTKKPEAGGKRAGRGSSAGRVRKG